MSIEITSDQEQRMLTIVVTKPIPSILTNKDYKSVNTQANLLESVVMHLREALDTENYKQARDYAEVARKHLRNVTRGLKEHKEKE